MFAVSTRLYVSWAFEVVENMLNKQSRISEIKWSCLLGVEQELQHFTLNVQQGTQYYAENLI